MTKILKNLLLLICIVAGVSYFSSCEQYTFLVENELPPVDTSGNDSTTHFVSLSKVIQPIFTDRCAGCHKPPRMPDLREGYSHASLTSGGYVNLPAATSKLYTKITNPSHKYATNAENDSIYIWISQGALDN